MAGEQWVVTFRAENLRRSAELISSTTTEFYRGSRDECLRIARAFADGSSDRGRTDHPWRVIIGKAEDWDNFLADLES